MMAARNTFSKGQRELEGLLLDLSGRSRSGAGVIASARARAGIVARAAGDTPEARVRSLVGLVGAGLCRAFLEHDAGGEGVDALLRALARLTDTTPEVAAVEAHVASIVDPYLHEIPPRMSIETQLRLLRALAPITGASLWVAEDGELREVAGLGDEVPARGAHIAARRIFEHRPSDTRAARGTLCSIPVLRWQRPYAALVARARPRTRERCLAFMEQAAASLSQTLERTYLLERNAARERSLVEAGERRLLRLGYDIHDGPLQDIIALAADARLFREQLAGILPDEHRTLVLGRVDDLQARLASADGDLRELAQSFESSSLLRRPLAETLRRELETFRARSKAHVALEIRGTFVSMSASQRLAILHLVQEALSNVREHSEATKVRVSLVEELERTQIVVADNGQGFAVDRVLAHAAERGRLGLVGMSERIRLLGGTFELDSQPGGPTIVVATIPRWSRLTDDPEDAAATVAAATG